MVYVLVLAGGSDVDTVTVYMVELLSRSRAAKASLQPVPYMKVAGSGLLQRSLCKTKKSFGFEADFK